MAKRISALVFIPVVSLILFCLVFGVICFGLIGPVGLMPMVFIGLPLIVFVAIALQLLDNAIKARRVGGNQNEH